MKLPTVTVEVVAMSAIARFLKVPPKVLTDVAADSDFTFGTNDRTLITRDDFIEQILEPAMDTDEFPASAMSVIAKVQEAVGEDTSIDLEA